VGVTRRLLLLILTACTAPAAELSVVSLNLDREQNATRIVQELNRTPGFGDADFYLLQEVVRPEKSATGVADEWAAKLGYRVEFQPAFSPSPGLIEGLAILSRFPLTQREVMHLAHYDLRFRTRSRIGLAVTADTPLGRVRIVDVHLDSRLNVWERETQLRPLAEKASQFDAPVIFGGDFNTSDMRWIGHTLPMPFLDNQRQTIRGMMARFGFTTPFAASRATHDLLGLQLDWIFLKGFESTATRIQPVKFSDHHAIRATIKPR
jgi:endonuclease/exonuclease/phosphatase family metal-dependent hydrolase